MKILPVRSKHCETCPFHDAGWTQLRGFLEARAMQATPICHSTGPGALKKGKGWAKEAHACRGARNLQLVLMHKIGYIRAPTDAAWAEKVAELWRR